MTKSEEPRGRALSDLRPVFSLWVERVSIVFAVIGGILTVVMAIHVAADVTGRNFFNAPVQGTIEFITYWWMPMIVFLALPYVEKKRAQITVTLVTDSLTGSTRDRAAVVTKFVSIVAVLFVLYLAFLSFSSSFNIGQTAPGGVPLPIWVGKGVMVLGLAQLLLQMIANGPTPAAKSPEQAAIALVEDPKDTPEIQGVNRGD